MRIRLPLFVGLAALGVALTVTPADAGSARTGTLSVPCDGTIHQESFQAGGFAASSTQFILGAEVTVVDPKGKLEYMLVRAEGDENKQILSIGPKLAHAGFAMPTFFQVTADALGNVEITVEEVCRKGPDLTAFVNIYFN